VNTQFEYIHDQFSKLLNDRRYRIIKYPLEREFACRNVLQIQSKYESIFCKVKYTQDYYK